jgi:tRNA modification GTPase
MTDDRDTIFALSSGRPPAAIAVVRISGARAGPALESLSGRMPRPCEAKLVRVRDPETGEVIDEALALWFPAPHSETGEDVAELQVHGGRAIIAAVLAALGKISGLRHAERGEFTRRAFENGRMDLTAAEGLADLVAAETQAQRRQAFQHMKGFLGQRAETWRERLLAALALVEAGIDFPDEGDVPQLQVGNQALSIVGALAEEISDALGGRGEQLREGFRVAIAGPPNAGKSTLFNRLARRDAAIVSPYPGTTRDVIEIHLDLDGYPVTILDTAGMRPSDDPIEQEGVRRATEQARNADLVLWISDAADADALRRRQEFVVSNHAAVWTVVNKMDLVADRDATQALFRGCEPVFFVSSATGRAVDELLGSLGQFAEKSFSLEPALVTRQRHRAHLQEALSSLIEAQKVARTGRDELLAEHLRLAAQALGKLLGRVDVEDVLDVIFREFCIGK